MNVVKSIVTVKESEGLSKATAAELKEDDKDKKDVLDQAKPYENGVTS